MNQKLIKQFDINTDRKIKDIMKDASKEICDLEKDFHILKILLDSEGILSVEVIER